MSSTQIHTTHTADIARADHDAVRRTDVGDHPGVGGRSTA